MQLNRHQQRFKISAAFAFLTIAVFSQSCGQDTIKQSLTADAYSSYNTTTLSTTIDISSLPTSYDSTINYALDLIGLPNTDIEIETTSNFGAFSVINIQNQRRFFVYSPTFFDSVYKVTQTKFAVLQICFHELAHHFYRHPLKLTNAAHFYEKQADRYSGFELAIIGATLDESLAAMNNIEKLGGKLTATKSHPDKESRLREIKKGFYDARIKIFHDSTYIKEDSIFNLDETMYAFYSSESKKDIKNLSFSSDSIEKYTGITIEQSESNEVYTFYGELIYISSDKIVKLLNGKQTLGNVLQPNPNLQSRILNLEGVKFYIDDDKIYSVNPDGYKLEVGNKINN